MRIVSLVPSWTETFLAAGLEVVGRTRFCIHPAAVVKDIPSVGGTKEVDWDKVGTLQPDLVIFDREENTQEMAQACPYPWLATHVQGLADVPLELERLGEQLQTTQLDSLTERWRALQQPEALSLQSLPVLEWWRRPQSESGSQSEIDQLVYLIWRRPWMSVSRQTFIGSVFNFLGWGDALPDFPIKYPEVDLEAFDPQRTLLLFSSEPYPFARHKELMTDLGFPCALVDGESYSWFGLRSLRFLEGVSVG